MKVLNRIITVVVLAVLAFGSYYIAPTQSKAFVNSGLDLFTAVVSHFTTPSEGTGASGPSFDLSGLGNLFSSSSPDGQVDYSFLAEGPDGLPTRWDPCQTIHVVVNANEATDGAYEDVTEALSRLSEATGLTFQVDGGSDQIPQSDWANTPWDGSAYPPVLIAWAKPSESDIFTTGEESGRGGPAHVELNGETRYVTGEVIINSEQNDLYAPGFGPGMTRGGLLLHELAHLVGMDHSDVKGEMMYPYTGWFSPEGYTEADLTGLAQVGASRGCAA